MADDIINHVITRERKDEWTEGVIRLIAITAQTPDKAEEMRMLPLSFSLPLCNCVVVLDECPPIKSDRLRLPGRLLVDGCEKVGGVHSELDHTDQLEDSVIRAEGNVVWANGVLVGGLGTFVDLINEKGGAARTHKGNGKGRKSVQ